MYDNKARIFTILIIIALVFSFFTIYISSAQGPGLSARAASLYEPETDTFIYTKNENERLSMASTTKIMTALIALENIDFDKLIEIPKEAVGIEGSSLYLEEGEILTAESLVYGLMLRSANDAATALAIEISGSVEAFSELMNERAREIGLSDTSFKNPHGLDDEGHFTTAHDLAKITAEALKNENFKKICSCYKKEIESSKKFQLVVNHNKLLKSYEGCIGVKTGYTKKSGRSLVSAAERDGLTLIAVTIDAPNDWRDHTELLDLGFSLIEKKALAAVGEYKFDLPVLDGEESFVTVSNKDSLSKIFSKNDADFEVNIKLNRYFAAPILKGDVLGEIIFTKDGKEIARLPLTADKDVNKKAKKGFFSFLKKD